MVFELHSGQYVPTKSLICSSGQDVYLCRQQNSNDDRLYTVNVIKDSTLIKKYLPLFAILKEQNTLQEFVDFSAQNAFLYAVFNYYPNTQENSLNSVKRFSLIRRLELSKRMVEYFISSKLPHEIQSIILDKDNININSSLKIYFNYCLHLNNTSDFYATTDIIKKLGNIFKELIFPDLLDRQPKLKEIIYKCESSHYKSLEALASDIDNLLDKLINNDYTANRSPSRHTLIVGIACLCLALCSAGVFYKVVIDRNHTPAYNADNSYNGLNQIGTVNLLHSKRKK